MSLRALITLKSATPEFEKETRSFIDRAVLKSAALMERNIKISATNSFQQRTGNLRRSITHRKVEFGKAEVGVNPVREGADTNYAIYLEYGTKYITPRAFIRKGIGMSQKAIKQIFSDEAKATLNKTKGVK